MRCYVDVARACLTFQGFGIASEAVDVTHDTVLADMPSKAMVEAWARGEDPEW